MVREDPGPTRPSIELGSRPESMALVSWKAWLHSRTQRWTDEREWATLSGMRHIAGNWSPPTVGNRLATCIGSVAAIAIAASSTEAWSRGCNRDVMIVFDGSGSMSETGFNQLDLPRIVDAREAVSRVMPVVSPVRRLGLLIYGPGPDAPCSNIDVRFPPLPNAGPVVVRAIEELEPAGNTPLATSVGAAAEVLDYQERPGEIVVITDGKETCGGAPCALAAELSAQAHELTIHVIGFKVRGDHFSWESQGGSDYSQAVTVARCLADATAGEYFSAESVDELAEALIVTLGCPSVSQVVSPGDQTG